MKCILFSPRSKIYSMFQYKLWWEVQKKVKGSAYRMNSMPLPSPIPSTKVLSRKEDLELAVCYSPLSDIYFKIWTSESVLYAIGGKYYWHLYWDQFKFIHLFGRIDISPWLNIPIRICVSFHLFTSSISPSPILRMCSFTLDLV